MRANQFRGPLEGVGSENLGFFGHWNGNRSPLPPPTNSYKAAGKLMYLKSTRFLYGAWVLWCGQIHFEDFRAQLSLPFQGPKKSKFSGPTPSSDPRNQFSRIKIIASPYHINKRYINGYNVVYMLRDVMILMRANPFRVSISNGPLNGFTRIKIIMSCAI